MAIMIWITFVIVILVDRLSRCHTDVIITNSTDHVCFREETFTELIRVPVQQEVKVRSSSWCLEIPPRCSNYKTEMRETIKLQNVTKTKTIEYCCEGYAEIQIGNETICKPICRGGCGRGVCHTPNECHCDPGYIGRHCTHRCQHGRWGEGCRFICKCRNGALCDNRTGKCRCAEGWIGQHCDQPCSDGFYGEMCQNHCECSSKRCDAITGECVAEDGVLFASIVDTERNYTEISSHVPALVLNDTNLLIESLNSSIANLTENIDKLAKNLNRSTSLDPVTVIVPKSLMETTTIKSLPEVIVIKQNDAMANAAIVVPSMSSMDNRQNPMDQKTGNSNVIRVIGNWQQQQQQHHHLPNHSTQNITKDSDWYTTDSMEPVESTAFEDSTNDGGINAILMVIAIFSVAILACSIGFVVLYRRHLRKLWNQSDSVVNETKTEIVENAKVLTKPLPDLPAFTQNLARQSYVPEFYDRPSNNTVVVKSDPLKESKYNGLSIDYTGRLKSCSRKGSVEHLYDEIKYNTGSESSRM